MSAGIPLKDLRATFRKITSARSHRTVISIAKADGLMLLCPKCFEDNGGPVGTHSVICWQPHVPQDIPPTPGRWEFYGTGLKDLTLVAGSSSVLLTSGCRAHFWIRDGVAVPCGPDWS